MENRAQQLTPSLFRYLACVLYEGILCLALLLVVTALWMVFFASFEASSIGGSLRYRIYQVFLWGGLAVYFGWFWSDGRVSLAMRTWGMQLATKYNQPLSYRKAVIRYFFAWFGPGLGLLGYMVMGKIAILLGFLNYFWVWIDPDQLLLHDRLAGTRLILTGRSANYD